MCLAKTVFLDLDAGGFFLFVRANSVWPLHLAGAIPSELGKLTALPKLYLYTNQLSGESLGRESSHTSTFFRQAAVFVDATRVQRRRHRCSRTRGITLLYPAVLPFESFIYWTYPPQLGDLGALEFFYLHNKLEGELNRSKSVFDCFCVPNCRIPCANVGRTNVLEAE